MYVVKARPLNKGDTNMLNKEIETIVNNNKGGTFVRIEWKTTKQPSAKHKDALIEKYCVAVGRLGCDYQHLKLTQQKIVEGAIEPNGKLSWGHWREGYVNYIIDHKEKSYLRITTSPIHKPISKWFLNGVETTKQYLLDNGYIPQSRANSKVTSVFNIPFDSIISIGA